MSPSEFLIGTITSKYLNDAAPILFGAGRKKDSTCDTSMGTTSCRKKKKKPGAPKKPSKKPGKKPGKKSSKR